MKQFRRIKKTENLRDQIKDVYFEISDLIYPLFIIEGKKNKEEIISMPGQYRYPLNGLQQEIDEISNLGIKSVLLFGIPENKDEVGSSAYTLNGIIQEAIKKIKLVNNKITVITDLCMCEYTNHGHCGIIEDGYVNNEKTLSYLEKIALSQANAGADIIAPSDMMDNRIFQIRDALDKNGFNNIPIMSYAVKYASSYYGPFRDAAFSAPQLGDRKSYQMDFRRKREAIDKIKNDIDEGADMAIIKPALAYLDILKTCREEVNIPLACYNVSGEYSMVKAAGAKNWIDEKKVVLENMYAFKRAGADMIITYHAKDIASWIK